LLVWVLLLIPVVIGFAYPFAQDYLRAASLLKRMSDPHASGWIANYDVHPVDVHNTNFDFRDHALPARVYLPRGVGFAPGIVLVHGLHEGGIDEPRLVRSARALAASGFFVMTPLVPALVDYRVEAESVDVIGAAIESFAHDLNVPRVGVLAISFSGGLALLAASDQQYAPYVAWVASVGGYYDLAHVLRFFATGEAVEPNGAVDHLSPHEYGPLIVIYDSADDFFSPHDAPLARQSIKLLLTGNGKGSEAATQQMTPAGQSVMQELYHKNRAALAPAILAEIDKRREQIAAASASGHLRFLRAPVLLLHGSDDDVIPPTELLWLKRDIPEGELVTALVSKAIGHVEMGGEPSLRDQLAIVDWMAEMIRVARRTNEGKSPRNLPAGVWISTPASLVNGW
jgi:pimeloyl-ACP methyl ester carboxylesterase